MTIKPRASSHLPTRFGTFQLHVFEDKNGTEHLALVKGVPRDGCLVRLHSECATGDIMGSLRCDCRDQLETSLRAIEEEGQGVLIYVRDHEGRGIGLTNKIKAYTLQDKGMDTVDANIHLGFLPDARDYALPVAVLKYFGLKKVRLLTNNRHKIEALEKAGIKVTESVSLWTSVNPHNERYIETKRNRMGHLTER